MVEGVGWEAVAHAYGDVASLDGFTCAAQDGELLVLLGPSGSGKSTALRVLAGLEAPTAGRVRIRGADVTAVPPHRRDVAMVFQDLALFPHLTVAQNLAFGPVVRRLPAPARETRLRQVLDALDLAALADRYPDQLSGGQRQRVALGRAMVREPAVFLLDEPLSSLDPALRVAAQEELVAVQRRLGVTTVHVTHDQSEALALADRLAVVRAGRVEQVDLPGVVYDRPATAFVAGFVGDPPMALLPDGRPLVDAPGMIVGVRAEDVRVVGDGGVAAVVARVEDRGHEVRLRVDLDGGPALHVRRGRRDVVPAVGERLRVAVDPPALHRFDAGTGRRLPDGGRAG